MADRGEIAFVFRVLYLDFFRGEAATIYRLDQVLVLARQSLPDGFNLPCVHFSILGFFNPDNCHREAESFADKRDDVCAKLHTARSRN